MLSTQQNGKNKRTNSLQVTIRQRCPRSELTQGRSCFSLSSRRLSLPLRSQPSRPDLREPDQPALTSGICISPGCPPTGSTCSGPQPLPGPAWGVHTALLVTGLTEWGFPGELWGSDSSLPGALQENVCVRAIKTHFKRY